jgi:hypothetical protein
MKGKTGAGTVPLMIDGRQLGGAQALPLWQGRGGLTSRSFLAANADLGLMRAPRPYAMGPDA